MTPLRRLFFALWPQGSWSARLIEAAAPVLAAAGGRAVAQVDLHVTLCFLGAAGEAQRAALCVRAGQIEAQRFGLAFDRLEFWRESRIVAATAARVPAAGLELAQSLASAARQAGLAPDVRAWRPHVTLVRGVAVERLPAELAAELAADALPAIRLTLPVCRFYLAESQGLGAQVCGASEQRRYATLASWPLRA
jgi:RNA 2',3'-cyclic 3'-phosphodiesterase